MRAEETVSLEGVPDNINDITSMNNKTMMNETGSDVAQEEITPEGEVHTGDIINTDEETKETKTKYDPEVNFSGEVLK